MSISGEQYCINADAAFLLRLWVIVVIVGYDTKLAIALVKVVNAAMNVV